MMRSTNEQAIVAPADGQSSITQDGQSIHVAPVPYCVLNLPAFQFSSAALAIAARDSAEAMQRDHGQGVENRIN